MALINLTIKEAKSILKQDPELEKPEHRLLAAQAALSMHTGEGEIN
jgi:hypothetical protein